MPFSKNLGAKQLLLTFFCFLLHVSHGADHAAATIHGKGNFGIGAIVNFGSRVGREQKTAMEIAVQTFNARSEKLKLFLEFRNSSGDPLQAAFAAEELIGRVQVLIGTEKWQEAALLAGLGSRAKVPIISLSSSAITPTFSSLQWPYLVTMGNDATEQTKCLAQIVHSHQWGKVILIYEDEPYGGDSGITTLLTEALQQIGSVIEYRLVLPPFASLANPKETVHRLLNQVNKHCNSRVFIVLDASWTLTRYLFEGAQEIGLAGNNSVWLMAEEIANLFPSFNYSVVEGGIGIKRYYSKSRTVFQDFEAQFWQKFSREYPEEENYDAGYYSLLAYDAVRAIGKAIEGSSNNASSDFLESFLALDFQGLSGEIYFEENRIARKPIYRMVNVVNRELKELEFWIPGLGFSRRLGNESSVEVVGEVGLLSEATWPGNLTRILPKGWNMPTEKKILRIGIPVSCPSKFLFLSETQEPKGVFDCTNSLNQTQPKGFTIDLFQKVLAKLNYSLPCHFYLQNVSYDDLILWSTTRHWTQLSEISQ
ncbi:hypothetical protein Droror1_Dr00010276 [Drosera rotundifolia]